MFHFRNCSSNAHQVWCDHCQSDDLPLHSRFQVRLGQYLSYNIQTWHDGRLMDAIYAHARLAQKNQRCMLSATKQAISIKLATSVCQFFTWPWLCKRLYGVSTLLFFIQHCWSACALNNHLDLSPSEELWYWIDGVTPTRKMNTVVWKMKQQCMIAAYYERGVAFFKLHWQHP